MPLSAATVRLVYRASTAPPPGTRMLLLVSADGGSTWRSYPLVVPAAANTDVVQSVDASAEVAGTLVPSLRLRYEVLPAGGTLSTAIDLAHVDAG